MIKTYKGLMMLSEELDLWLGVDLCFRDLFNGVYPVWFSTGIIDEPYALALGPESVASFGPDVELYPSSYVSVYSMVFEKYLSPLFSMKHGGLGGGLDGAYEFRCFEVDGEYLFKNIDVDPMRDSSLDFIGRGSSKMVATLNWAFEVIAEWKLEFMPGLQDLSLGDAGSDCFIDSEDRASIGVESVYQFRENDWLPFLNSSAYTMIHKGSYWGHSMSEGLNHIGEVELREGIYQLYFNWVEVNDSPPTMTCSNGAYSIKLSEVGNPVPVEVSYESHIIGSGGDLYVGSVGYDPYLSSSGAVGTSLMDLIDSPIRTLSMGSVVAEPSCSICDNKESGKKDVE